MASPSYRDREKTGTARIAECKMQNTNCQTHRMTDEAKIGHLEQLYYTDGMLLLKEGGELTYLATADRFE